MDRAIERPWHILFITTDQERRWEDLPTGFPFGSVLPNRQRLLQGATDFAQMTIATNPCTPSRAALYTGRHLQETGIFQNFQDLPESVPTIGTLLREQGYYTAYKGKWHLTMGLTDPEELNGPVRKMIMSLGQPGLTGSLERKCDDFRLGLEPYGFSDFNADGDKWGNAHEGFNFDGSYAANAAEWLREKGSALDRDGQPFFLAVNFVNPHDIMFFEASEDQSKTRMPSGPFSTQKLQPAPDDPTYNRRHGLGVPHTLHAHDELPVVKDPARALPRGHSGYKYFSDLAYGKLTKDEEYEKAVDYYLNCMADVDRHIGTVLDALDASGLSARTIVVLTADHGEMLGSHGLRQKGPPLYKENFGVPFIVRHPALVGQAPRRCTRVCSHIDVLPTLLAMALGDGGKRGRAVAAAAGLQGRDFSGLLWAPNDPGPRDCDGALFQFGMAPPGSRSLVQAIVSEQYVFGRFFAKKDTRPSTIEDLVQAADLVLFDHAADPDEIRNLAATPELVSQHRDIILNLNTRLNTLLASEALEKPGVRLPWMPWSTPAAGGDAKL